MTVVWLFFLLRIILSPRLSITYGSVFPVIICNINEYHTIKAENNVI